MAIYTFDFERKLMNEIDQIARSNRFQPLFIGGVAGPNGGVITGPITIIGQIPQSKVTFDTTEGTGSGIAPSGSLVHNLNRIRGGWAMGDSSILRRHIASGVGILTVGEYNTTTHIPNVADLEFENVEITSVSTGVVKVTVLGTGTGGSGSDNYYLSNDDAAASSPPVTSKYMKLAVSDSERSVTQTGSAYSFFNVYNWITEVSSPGITSIPFGTWNLVIDAIASASDIYQLSYEVFKWDGATSTPLFTSSYKPFSNYRNQLIIPASAPDIVLAPTDRLYVSVYCTNAGASSVDVTLYFAGSTGARLVIPVAGNSVTEFINLTDVPNTYNTQKLKVPRVKFDETGLEFVTQSGVSNFLALTDTPDSYASQKYKVARVNSAENALEFVSVSGGGATVFTQLSDVPNSYAGQAVKVVRVKSDETGLEFVTASGGGGSGATVFTSLTDVPNSYTGQAFKIPRVKSDESGLEFTTPSGVTHNLLSTTHIDTTPATGVLGDLITWSGGTWRKFPGNTQATTKYLAQLGDGVNSGSPFWATVAAGTDANAIHTNVANEISGITEKTSADANDLIVIEDSAASFVKKKIKKSNLVVSSGGKIEINIDGGGATATTGILLDFIVPVNLTITDWTVLADQTGSIVIDLWKNTYASFPPTISNTVTGSDKPRLTSQSKNTGSSLTGWTTSWSAGDIIRVNVDSASSVQKINITLSYI